MKEIINTLVNELSAKSQSLCHTRRNDDSNTVEDAKLNMCAA